MRKLEGLNSNDKYDVLDPAKVEKMSHIMMQKSRIHALRGALLESDEACPPSSPQLRPLRSRPGIQVTKRVRAILRRSCCIGGEYGALLDPRERDPGKVRKWRRKNDREARKRDSHSVSLRLTDVIYISDASLSRMLKRMD